MKNAKNRNVIEKLLTEHGVGQKAVEIVCVEEGKTFRATGYIMETAEARVRLAFSAIDKKVVDDQWFTFDQIRSVVPIDIESL